ncbi:MAG: hypothetical protein ACE5GX_11270 [Thermoanaerobaculia bacterium]
MKRTTQKIALAVALMTLLGSGIGWAKGKQNRLRLRGELVGAPAAGDISGKADFENRRGRRKFSVEIEGLGAGDKFDVTVDGVNVGTIVVNALGIGELDYDDTAGPLDQDLPFPAGFPSLDGGEAVAVGGTLSGTLQPK